MTHLVFAALVSLDGKVADDSGGFAFAAPDEELHEAVNDLLRPMGTHLYGRRTYDVLRSWDDVPDDPDQLPVIRDFARIWRAADKVVYSRTLTEASAAPRTRLVRSFDPDGVARLKAAAEADIGIGGPGLAAEAFAAGLVDECHLFVFPVIVGSGLAALPAGHQFRLGLVGVRGFASGVVHLRHRVLD